MYSQDSADKLPAHVLLGNNGGAEWTHHFHIGLHTTTPKSPTPNPNFLPIDTCLHLNCNLSIDHDAFSFVVHSMESNGNEF
jgi:hypothetical protein